MWNFGAAGRVAPSISDDEGHIAQRGRPKIELVLSEEERDTVARWARHPNSPQSLALRSKIVLAGAAGKTSRQAAAELHCNKVTVGKWRQRFVAKRLQGLADEYRPGVPRSITDDHVETVVAKTLTEEPKDPTHWSMRRMAKATGMSQPTISRIWKAFGLKPWLEDTFKLPSDALFIDKVRDIVGLYLNPPERAVVLCVDKAQVQSLDRTQPILPLPPVTPERCLHDYVRRGTIDLYAAFTLTSGTVIHQLTADVSTLPGMTEDLRQRFGVGRIALVADTGLVSEDNLALVAAYGFDHVLATRLHHDGDLAAVLEQANGPETAWTAVPEANSFCAEITHDSRRFVVVFSPVRYFRDKARHLALCARIEDGLIALEQRVRSGRLTDPAKIGAAADRVLRSSPVGRCFVVNVKKGFFSWNFDEKACR